jgi:hypothetical protein
MSIEDLIRDLIVEDQFQAKYTKRQRSIFCKNMYAKISTFLQKHEEECVSKYWSTVLPEELTKEKEELAEELEETKYQLKKYKRAYQSILKRETPFILVEQCFRIMFILYGYYFLYNWIIASMPTDQSPRQRQIM